MSKFRITSKNRRGWLKDHVRSDNCWSFRNGEDMKTLGIFHEAIKEGDVERQVYLWPDQ